MKARVNGYLHAVAVHSGHTASILGAGLFRHIPLHATGNSHRYLADKATLSLKHVTDRRAIRCDNN